MKKYFLLFAVIVLSSCAKIICEDYDSAASLPLSKEDALSEFSVILSKAVCEEPSLRAFLKTKALAKFDCDYDVFYPFVKGDYVKPDMCVH